MHFAILVSQFNTEVTEGLFAGAVEYLKTTDSTFERYAAPGAFEMPLLAKALASTGKFQGIICLGCVIKGDTAHFEFISLGATIGIQMAALDTQTPIAFGILTTYNDEQAELRSKAGAENKGKEAAKACYESAGLLKKIRN